MSLYLCCYNWPLTRLILTRLVNQMQELWCGSTDNTAVRELWDCSGRSQLRITTVTDAWFCNKRELLQPCQVHIAWIISLFHLLMLRWHTKDLVHFQLMFLLTNFLLMHPSEKHHKYFWRQTLIIWKCVLGQTEMHERTGRQMHRKQKSHCMSWVTFPAA